MNDTQQLHRPTIDDQIASIRRKIVKLTNALGALTRARLAKDDFTIKDLERSQELNDELLKTKITEANLVHLRNML